MVAHRRMDDDVEVIVILCNLEQDTITLTEQAETEVTASDRDLLSDDLVHTCRKCRRKVNPFRKGLWGDAEQGLEQHEDGARRPGLRPARVGLARQDTTGRSTHPTENLRPA